MQISFLGALSSVGASGVLVDTGIEKILLDHGTKIREVPPRFPIPIQGKPDAILLSHCHLDHSGGVGIFHAKGQSCPIYSIDVTKPLTELLLLDSLKISHEEGISLPFTKKDVQETIKSFVTIPYRQKFKIRKTTFTFFDAGHVPGCLTPDTLVQLPNGEMDYIKDLPEKVKVLCIRKDKQKIGSSEGIVWRKKFDGELIEIITRTSRIITTKEHRLFKFDGAIQEASVEDLKEGDYIVAVRNLPVKGKIQKLPAIKQSTETNALKINITRYADENVCQCIGYFIGDGSLSSGEMSLFEKYRDVAEFYKRLYNKTFRVNPHITYQKDKNMYVTRISSVNLVKLFKKMNIKTNSESQEVSKIIQRSDLFQVAAFLRGLFDADGYVQKDSIGICSASKKLTLQIKFLLLRFGITSHYREKYNRSEKRFSEGALYVLEIFDPPSIKLFKEKIDFSHFLKRKRLKNLCRKVGKSRRKSKVDVFPFLGSLLREVCETFQKRGAHENLRIQRNEFPVTIKHFYEGCPISRDSLKKIVKVLLDRLIEIRNLSMNDVRNWSDLQKKREILRISQRELAEILQTHQSKIYTYEKTGSDYMLSEGIKSLNLIRKGILENTEPIVAYLKALAESEIFFDKIKKINDVSFTEKTVFDLEVNPHHNFIANGIISHNSAMTFLNFGDKNLLYTGDLKTTDTRLLEKADEDLPKIDYLIIESTYSEREHPDRKSQEKELIKIINETLAVDGHCLLAGFAIGRLQEILLILDKYGIDYQLFMDGMAKKATTIINQHNNLLKEPGSLDRALKKVQYVSSEKARNRILKQPSVILTTSGMLTGGPVVRYLKKLYSDRKSSLVLTGWQLEDTPGKILLETGRYVTKSLDLEVKMFVKRLDFSAHLGRSELFEFVNKLNPEKVFCVHGDHTEEFASELREKGFDAVAPIANNRIFSL